MIDFIIILLLWIIFC